LHAPVLPQLVEGTVGSERDGTTVEPWTNPIWTVVEFIQGIRISFASGVLGVGVVFVFGVGLFSYARTKPVLVALMLIPIIVGTAVTVGLGRYLRPRFFFFAVGFAALVAIRGTMSLGEAAGDLLRLSRARSAWIGTVLSAMLVLVSLVSIRSAYGPKQDFGGALAFVEGERESGDAIVTVGLATYPYERYYDVDWEKAETLDQLNAIRSRAVRTWVLYTLPVHLESMQPEIMVSIQREFELVKPFYGTLGGGTIFVCRSDAPPVALPEAHWRTPLAAIVESTPG
jgi:hypothetical protein